MSDAAEEQPPPEVAADAVGAEAASTAEETQGETEEGSPSEEPAAAVEVAAPAEGETSPAAENAGEAAVPVASAAEGEADAGAAQDGDGPATEDAAPASSEQPPGEDGEAAVAEEAPAAADSDAPEGTAEETAAADEAGDDDLADIENPVSDVDLAAAADPPAAAAAAAADDALAAAAEEPAAPAEGEAIVVPTTTAEEEPAPEKPAEEEEAPAPATDGAAAEAAVADGAVPSVEGDAQPEAEAASAAEPAEAAAAEASPTDAAVEGEGAAAAAAAARPRSGAAGKTKDINVTIAQDDGSFTTVKVSIEFPSARKPFLGGYRNQKTGIEYHHCSAQTYIRVKKPDGKVRVHRDVQTKQVSSGTTNDQMTTSHTSTQMSAPGIFVDPVGDSEIEPKPYETAEVWHGKRVAAVIVLQSHLRRVNAAKRVEGLRQQKKQVEEYLDAEEDRKVVEEEAEWQRRVDRRVNPRTKADFDLLYRGLEVWRLEELEKVHELETDDQIPAKVALLQQQCTYLNAIDKLKIEADTTNREKRIAKFFDNTSAPREWVEEEYGKVNQMETLGTLRSRELREVYFALGLTSFDVDERLDILLHVKLIVQEFDAKLTREIVDLLNREADLLLRGTKKGNLGGLRKRIRNMFLQFCEEPEYNPMSERYLSKHKDKDAYKDSIAYCASCLKYHDISLFPVSTTDDVVSKCTKCLGVTNIAVQRADTTQHKRMLEALQKSEIARGYKSQIVFMMSVEDVVYLVDTIWRGQSALSQEDELFRLTLARWDRHKEFSPWNCVLLTRGEAETHEALQDIGLSSYGSAFTRLIQQKHLLARNYFFNLVEAQKHGVAEAEEDDIFLDATGAQIVRTMEM